MLKAWAVGEYIDEKVNCEETLPLRLVCVCLWLFHCPTSLWPMLKAGEYGGERIN